MPSSAASAVALRQVFNIDDLRRVARRRLPRGFFEYIDRGAEDELALRRNRAAFDRMAFVPRHLLDTSGRSSRTRLFGRDLAAPMAVAPTAAAGLLWHRGEQALARAARAAGIPFTLSTASIAPLEAVASEAGGNLWFQLYVYPDLSMTHELVARVQAAGYATLLVTVDTTVSPNREYNQRNAFHVPLRLGARMLWDTLTHPRWAASVVLRHLVESGMPQFVNLPEALRTDLRGKGGPNLMPKNEATTWDLIRRLRDQWKGALVVKGLLHPQDALLAADCGVDGIVVSNHGGRNADAVVAPLEVLPAIAQALDGRIAVLADSGIRRGSDIAKALALGADAVLIGRSALWGVASAGEAGAARSLAILQTELTRVMAQLGVTDVAQLRRAEYRILP